MKDRIYIKEWQKFKPDNFSSNTDLYYLKVANKIHANLTQETVFVLSNLISDEDIKLLCCFITSYFEDLISQTNIWHTFKSQYKNIYNKTLPFYALNDTYIEDEINFEDVVFLVWYFLNTTQQEKFLGPTNHLFYIFAESAMQILDEEYEFAPENTKLKTLFTYNTTNVDFYTTRAFIQLVFFESYLFSSDVKQRLDLSVFEIIQEKSEQEDPEIVMSFIREITEDYTFNKRSALLALTGKDWASNLIGSKHPEFKNTAAITKKIVGLFLYKGQDKNVVTLEHIASGMRFDLTKKSFDHYKDFNEDIIIFIGLVKWNKEWWFSGGFNTSHFSANLILDLKNSTDARAQVNFLNDKKVIDNILKTQEKAFLKFNKNKPIAFIKTKDVEKFTSQFLNYFNKSLNLSKKDIDQANKRTKEDGYFGEDHSFNELEGELEESIVFFNPKSGLEIYYGVTNAFPDKNNPFFTKESDEDIMHILISPEYSTEFVYYFINTYKNKLAFFKDETNKAYLEDIDFLLRFWKKDSYFTEPTQILTGKPN